MSHYVNNTYIKENFQPFIFVKSEIFTEFSKLKLIFESKQQTSKVCCPYCKCNNSMEHERNTTEIKDMPSYPKLYQSLEVHYHRYVCKNCNKHFSEELPFKILTARLTYRAASWIRCLLEEGKSISSVSKISGIHWDTIKLIHEGVMDEFLMK